MIGGSRNRRRRVLMPVLQTLKTASDGRGKQDLNSAIEKNGLFTANIPKIQFSVKLSAAITAYNTFSLI